MNKYVANLLSLIGSGELGGVFAPDPEFTISLMLDSGESDNDFITNNGFIKFDGIAITTNITHLASTALKTVSTKEYHCHCLLQKTEHIILMLKPSNSKMVDTPNKMEQQSTSPLILLPKRQRRD